MNEREVTNRMLKAFWRIVKDRKLQGQCVLWRNNLSLHERDGRYYRSGLPVGSSDYIGIWRGLFLAVEVKGEKRKTPYQSHQRNFIEAVNKAGGIAIEVNAETVGNLPAMLDELYTQRRNS